MRARADEFLNMIADPEFERSLEGITRAFRALKIAWPEWNKAQQAAVKHRLEERLGIDSDRFYFLLRAPDDDRRRALRWKPIEQPLAPDELIYPREGFFGDYLRYASLGEGHVGFHFWSAVAILAAAMRRNFYLDRGGHSYLYPNLYLLLVGSTGSGKGTAATRALDILRRMNQWVTPTDSRPDAPVATFISGDELTVSSIVHELLQARQRTPYQSPMHPELNTESCAIFPSEEATTLFGRDAYKPDQMIGFLTKAFDGSFYKSTRAHGSERVENLALTCLFLSTMEWLRKTMTEHVFRGGFMGARILPIPKEKSRLRSYHVEPTLDPIERDRLARLMAESFPMRQGVEIQLDRSADALLKEWYNSFSRDRREEESRIKGYLERRDIHLLKLAMVLTVAYGREPFITVATLGEAIRILGHEEPAMFETMNEMVAQKTVDHMEILTLTLVRGGGELSRTQFFQKISHRFNGRREMIDAVELALATGRIGRRVDKGRRGPPKEVYYLPRPPARDEHDEEHD